ncbi:adenine-specific DNA-methyltransferase, partial [Escherichia coli]
PKELEKVKKRKTKNKSKNIRDDIDNISNPLNNDLLFNQEDHTLI